MAKFDQGGGCTCGLYRVCECDMSEIRAPQSLPKSTPEDAKRVAEAWRLNDERNQKIELRKTRMQELDDIACIDEGDWAE